MGCAGDSAASDRVARSPSRIGNTGAGNRPSARSSATAAALVSQGSPIVPLQIRSALTSEVLLGQANVDDKLLEDDDFSKDPRFMFTPAELEKKGIKDFQLDYALKTLKRLGTKSTSVASASPPKRP